MAEYTEDCCFNYEQDNCKGAGCPCGCHVKVRVPIRPDCGHEAEMERCRQRSRDEDTARIRLNHARIEAEAERDKAQALAASLSADWHRIQKQNTRLRAALEESHRYALNVAGCAEAYGETESAHLWNEIAAIAEEVLWPKRSD